MFRIYELTEFTEQKAKLILSNADYIIIIIIFSFSTFFRLFLIIKISKENFENNLLLESTTSSFLRKFNKVLSEIVLADIKTKIYIIVNIIHQYFHSV